MGCHSYRIYKILFIGIPVIYILCLLVLLLAEIQIKNVIPDSQKQRYRNVHPYFDDRPRTDFFFGEGVLDTLGDFERSQNKEDFFVQDDDLKTQADGKINFKEGMDHDVNETMDNVDLNKDYSIENDENVAKNNGGDNDIAQPNHSDEKKKGNNVHSVQQDHHVDTKKGHGVDNVQPDHNGDISKTHHINEIKSGDHADSKEGHNIDNIKPDNNVDTHKTQGVEKIDSDHSVDRGAGGGVKNGVDQGKVFEGVPERGPNDEKQISESPEETLRRDLIKANVSHSLSFLDKPIGKYIGYMGYGSSLKTNNLTAQEKREMSRGWELNRFNEFASDRIPIHRVLPDPRDPRCLTKDYREDLPPTSVIICFCNEAISILLRTIHSILDRSPPHLLREIILIDDFSDLVQLKQPLERYISKQDKVRLIRTKKREGLIRARLLGYAEAKAKVLTFLDSHVEVTKGWLEPLLDRVAQNWTNVVAPLIPIIKTSTLDLLPLHVSNVQLGGFTWDMAYTWIYPEVKLRSQIKPLRSPTMAGGLFTIHKDFFSYLGTYDPDMDFWGGENLELSFKIWMCGGTLETLPCSHVGHIYRETTPITWNHDSNVSVQKNLLRVADVWMDDYKKFYFQRYGGKLPNYGDTAERKALREKLKCRSFEWYLQNIYPAKYIPVNTEMSMIKNEGVSKCVQASDTKKPIRPGECERGADTMFWITDDGSIRNEAGCLDYSGKEPVSVLNCHGLRGNQEWKYRQDKTLFSVFWKTCLEISGLTLKMQPCGDNSTQKWTFGTNET